MAHPAQARARFAVAATALTEPSRHVAALKPPAEPAPCVRRVYGGYAEVEDDFRRRLPPTVLVSGLPFELPEVPNCTTESPLPFSTRGKYLGRSWRGGAWRGMGGK